MKSSFLFILLLTSAGFLHAQNTISGTVFSVKGDPLPGVNIYIKGTLDGGTSDINGYFHFATTSYGKQILIASMIGMESLTMEVLVKGEKISAKIVLKEAVSELNAVVISAGVFESGEVKKAAVLNSIDIATTAGATADIFGALQTLPGTLPSMEESGLFVRGGDASESKTFFDGILVNKAFTSDLPDISQRGRFSPFMFKGTSFSTGAYGATYGGALSSTIMMESKDLVPKTKSEIGIMSVGVSAGHAQRFKNSSIEVDGSYYNLKPIFEVVKQNTKWIKEPESGQGSAFYKVKTGDKGMLKIYGCYEMSQTGLSSSNLEDITKISNYNIKSKSLYLNSTWSQFIGKQWKIFVGGGYGDDMAKVSIDTNDVHQNDQSFHGRFVVTRYFGKLSDVKAGLDYFQINKVESYNESKHSMTNLLPAGFVEANIYAGNAFVIRPGIRFEMAGLNREQNIAPRLSLAYQLNDASQVSAGYGIYYQLPADEYLYESADLNFENATHVVLNYHFKKNKRTFRAEAYFKKYSNLVKEYPELSNEGYGYSKGIDLFYRDNKTIRYADFWLTYSIIDSKRIYRDYPEAATPTFVAAHVINAVGKYFISQWSTSVGATYTFASGRTYYNPNSEKFLADKTKPYHNFSMNFSYLTHFCKKFTIIYLSVENVFGIENIYGYRYSPNGFSRKPIRPSAPRSIFLGVFITFGDENPLNI